MRVRGIRISTTLATGLVCVLVAAPATGRNAPAPKGLPLPTGMRFIDSRAGNSHTAFVWTSTYATNRPARDMARYAALLKRRGALNLTRGPGVNLSFHFKRWDVFACADPGCAAPKGRFTLIVATPGG